MTEPTRSALADAQLFFEQEMAGAVCFEMDGGTAAVHSTGSPDREGVNEDAAGLIPFGQGASVLVVADGVGGVRGGEQASRIAVDSLRKELASATRRGAALRSAILDAIEVANDAVGEMAVGAATTLAVVEIQDGAVRPYHVGDSLVLVVGGRGRVKLQTVAHSPVGFAVEAGVIDEEEAMHHEDRHLVSNVLGSRDMRIEVGSARRLAPMDTVVVASDGLADNFQVTEIAERLSRGPLEIAANELAAATRERMLEAAPGRPSKPDDLTFIAYRSHRRR